MQKNIKHIVSHVGHVIDLWLPLKIKYDKVPGLSVGIVYQGKILYANNFGYADASKKKKPYISTLYHIASISKTFTALAILQLVDEGRLRLDDKVAQYVGWLNAKSGEKDAHNITIRQLLSHTSGLFRDGGTPHWETGNFPKDLRKTFSSSSLTLENSTGFKYTNYGFSILGIVIEKVSGMSYEKYIQTHILQPLHMNKTAADYSSSLKNIATGYGREIPDQKRQVFPHYKTNAYAPATGFLSNIQDLARYLSVFVLGGKENILSREFKKEMMRLQERTEDGEEYGLGLILARVGKRKLVGHSGGFNGFSSQILVDPQSGIGVVVLENSLRGSASALGRGILEMIFDALDHPENFQGKLPHYGQYEGTYRHVWGDFVVAQWGRKLLEFSPQNSSPTQYNVVLAPTKKVHEFIMKGESAFDNKEETTAFSKFTGGKANVFLMGSTPARRVKIKD